MHFIHSKSLSNGRCAFLFVVSGSDTLPLQDKLCLSPGSSYRYRPIGLYPLRIHSNEEHNVTDSANDYPQDSRRIEVFCVCAFALPKKRFLERIPDTHFHPCEAPKERKVRDGYDLG